jgi:hypothetical protein
MPLKKAQAKKPYLKTLALWLEKKEFRRSKQLPLLCLKLEKQRKNNNFL